jgi:hypothetical protein
MDRERIAGMEQPILGAESPISLPPPSRSSAPGDKPEVVEENSRNVMNSISSLGLTARALTTTPRLLTFECCLSIYVLFVQLPITDIVFDGAKAATVNRSHISARHALAYRHDPSQCWS